jgi:hypothetical protein
MDLSRSGVLAAGFPDNIDKSEIYMKRTVFVFALASASLLAAGSAWAGDDVLKFEGGIGSQPFANVGNAPVSNLVFGIAPGGRPWVIRKLHARINTIDGRISVRGAGLLLGGGNGIGGAALPRLVVASLFCNGSAKAVNSPFVPLDIHGDFTIKGDLSDNVPSPCATPVLLIRTVIPATEATPAAPGAWFAAGIPASGDDD